MIQRLAQHYQFSIAYIFFLLFVLTLAPASYGTGVNYHRLSDGKDKVYAVTESPAKKGSNMSPFPKDVVTDSLAGSIPVTDDQPDIGGPSQPEMASFKSVGTDNMVNLFTGDFNYNIPLLDVGGYPVNIFYDGSISMEQEASWVGLGWNINPGTVSRNMRGIPDDFNGTEELKQTQKMKPNKTWGISLGANLELMGKGILRNFEGSVGASLGFSLNNYLGPALDLGLKGTTSFSIKDKVTTEKSAVGVGGSLGINIGSRSGFSLSPSVSMSATHNIADKKVSHGLSLSTSYNSRTGIKSLHLAEQTSTSFHEVRKMEGGFSVGSSLWSSRISFARPTYIPAIRMPVTNSSGAGNFQFGTGIFGTFGSVQAEVYFQKSTIEGDDVYQKKPMVGYLYYEKARKNANAVMDFTRFNDGAVTPNTNIISAPQYAYDVFTIQGEGTGGSIRAYRDDLGYMRDNETSSRDDSWAAGADVGIPGHYGVNFNQIKTPSTIGDWNAGNKLKSTLQFETADKLKENVYFRSPGETSVLDWDQFNKIGGDSLVRFKLGGTNSNPTVEPVLEKFINSTTPGGTVNMLTVSQPTARKKRTQVTSFLTAGEAAQFGLDRWIKSYAQDGLLNGSNLLKYDSMARVEGDRKAHHISQINVTEVGGMRYVYGIPVYNLKQKDFSFTIPGLTVQQAMEDDTVPFDAGHITASSTELQSNSKTDGFLQVTETPAYAHSFLLSGLLSPDYVDITGDGITDDDLGNAVKFNYSKIKSGGNWAVHKWRTPLSSSQEANFNPGSRSEVKDDKGIISYGERESWYLHSIESKTMIAVFTLGNRNDGKGANGELGGINASEQSIRKLEKIDLYSKSDLRKNGLAGAKPIKTVHFAYSYSLCASTPDNTVDGGGKLTLDSIYFTFNGVQDKKYNNKYVFAYTNGEDGNPNYELNASDRWGSYKPKTMNPAGLRNADYPYSIQDKSKKATVDANAGAWALKKILLPSGGQIEVTYEADDYAFVQNRRAAQMMELVGFGSDASTPVARLYENIGGGSVRELDHVFIRVPEPCANKTEVFQKYLQNLDQLLVRMAVQMPKGTEYITGYGSILDYGKLDDEVIWVKVAKVDGKSPYSLAAVEYLREQLPGQAFKGYDLSSDPGLAQLAGIFEGMAGSLASAFKDPVKYLREDRKLAKNVTVSTSFVRLSNPTGFKYGGGNRVKSVKLKDNWNRMTEQHNSEFGQIYEYTTTENFNGTTRTISSGVASYEPGIGGEENPFMSILQIANRTPLGPASYGAVELPFLDAFFPAPVVGYSKVTVRSLRRGSIDTARKSKSNIGKQVTEFYTAKDFPVVYTNTSLDPASDKVSHSQALGGFLFKYSYDSRAISQGFLVAVNDMHGKMKSQASYSAIDTNTAINYTENFYRNTGKKGLQETFDFVYNKEGGVIRPGRMGVDIELMTDVREFAVRSYSMEFQGQLDLFPVFFPFWLPFPWDVSSETEDIYRAVTTTKVINYHAILDSVLVIDKGSKVSTKNLVYDSETGEVIVNRTNNEFKDPIYTTSYPAYWAYSGMGAAYKNIDARFTDVNFLGGVLMTSLGTDAANIFESGDEIIITNVKNSGGDACSEALKSSTAIRRLWVFDRDKQTSSLSNSTPEFVFIDSIGRLYTQNGVSFRIVRSGKRNQLTEKVASVSSRVSPVTGTTTKTLDITGASKVINAGAVEFQERWQTDNDVIRRLVMRYDELTCNRWEEEDCDGYLEKSINPYLRGLLGTFRSHRSLVYYGDRARANVDSVMDLRKDGILAADFALYWNFDGSNNLVPSSSPNWVWNSEITRINSKGMELETRDALNIYTAAQYGYNRTMPVAIVNNSRLSEMAYGSFEDEGYVNALSITRYNSCGQPHFDFSGFSNAAVKNSTQTGFPAHTGKSMLEVSANSTAAVNVKVASSLPDQYSLAMGTEMQKQLSVLGGTYYKDSAAPSGWPVVAPELTTSNLGMILEFDENGVDGEVRGGTSVHYYRRYRTVQYTQISTPDVYRFVLNTSISDAALGYPPTYTVMRSDMSLKITNVNTNEEVAFFNLYNNPDVSSLIDSAFLTCDIYKIECFVSADIERPYSGSGATGFHDVYVSFDYSSNTGSTSYKNLTYNDLCEYITPIKGDSTMFNPVFTVPAEKKMLFSAWVKEPCTSAPCTTYANNKVQLQFTGGGGSTIELRPAGPVIEGWQRYESPFTAPAGATDMAVKLVNLSATAKLYVDDIRIHPFNANMKSYVYDPVNLRLLAELDPNNYARFYEYDEEGTLIRTKAETEKGIKTITETRSAKQKEIVNLQ